MARTAGAAGAIAFKDDTLKLVRAISKDSIPDPTDEKYWAEIRKAFYTHPTLTVLNNVGVAPSPIAAVEATTRELKRAASDPSYVMWREQDHELDSVITDLALIIGCDKTELALVPNASYGLQTTIMGLPMQKGDEVVLPSHEYPRTFTAADQRARREGTAFVTVELDGHAMTPEEIVKRTLAKITDKTKLVVLSHISFLIGQIQPIAEIAKECTKRNIPFLTDGAQSIGLLPDTISDFNSPIYAACLHKWIMGPVGTGVFVVKQPWRGQMWPLHPADDSLKDQMIKFQQVGTHPTAPYLALRESLDLHHQIGQPAKYARLAYLRKRLIDQIQDVKAVTFMSSLDPKVCFPFVTFSVNGHFAPALAGELLQKHKIHITTSNRAGVDGIRVSPNIITSADEIDRFAKIIRSMAS